MAENPSYSPLVFDPQSPHSKHFATFFEMPLLEWSGATKRSFLRQKDQAS